MIITSNVNKNEDNFTKEQIMEAYEDIKRACAKQFYVSNSKSIDNNKIKYIFDFYFNKNNPILDINSPIFGMEWTPLMLTCWLGYKDSVQKILSLGADPFVKFVCKKENKPIANALHLAITAKKEDVAIQLLNHNSDLINSKTTKGQTPLMLACEAGLTKVVEHIIKIPNVNILEKDNAGNDFEYYCLKGDSNFIDIDENKNIKKLLSYYLLDKTINQNNKIRKTNKI